MTDVRTAEALMRTDFVTFVHRVFLEVQPGQAFSDTWHIQALCFALAETGNRRRRRQIIEVPPRSLKSICASVALVAWLLGHDPRRQIMCVSYSQELAVRFSNMTRQVLKSAWYRKLFPHTRINPEKDTERYFMTTAGGFRDATSVGGTITGKGADLIIVDDPGKPDEMMSEAQRTAVNEWFDRTLSSRLNNKRTDGIILVMQRLHPDDLSGHVKTLDEWNVLTIPAIAVQDERIQIGSNSWHDRREGEVLDPSREPIEVLDQQKLQMGSRDFQSQYQQDPLPANGGIIDWRWFQTFDQPPDREGTEYFQSWDMASKNTEYSDYSVCTTWAVRGGDYYLLDIFRKKLTFPELHRATIEQASRWPVETILVEDAAAGQQIIQQLALYRPNRMPKPLAIKPERDKQTRLHAASPIVEQGRVFLPLGAPWLDELKRELIQFPTGKHDDQVDSISQFLNYAEKRRLRGPMIVILPMFPQKARRQR
ncbi:phage terminase large subunit [Sphingomonas sp.]|uniref:phage terminase large subunit n=1 Tax=Sphingomonas sp. TaxID=28214 RepID=UPI003CC5A417